MQRKLYSRIIPFGDNFIVRQHKLWGIVSLDDDIMLPIEYDMVYWYNGGFAGLLKNDKWGLVDSCGKMRIMPKYKYLSYKKDLNICIVYNGKKEIAVDVNDGVELLNGASVRVCGQKLRTAIDDKQQLFNLDGSVFSNIYDEIYHLGDCTYFAIDGERRCFIESNGIEIYLPYNDVKIESYLNGIAVFVLNGKYGLIDLAAKIILQNKYDHIKISDDLIAINKGRNIDCEPALNGEWYFLDYELNRVNNYCYQDVEKRDDVLYAKRGDLWYKVTLNGEILFAKGDASYKRKKSQMDSTNNGLKLFYQKSRVTGDRRFYVIARDGYKNRKS